MLKHALPHRRSTSASGTGRTPRTPIPDGYDRAAKRPTNVRPVRRARPADHRTSRSPSSPARRRWLRTDVRRQPAFARVHTAVPRAHGRRLQHRRRGRRAVRARALRSTGSPTSTKLEDPATSNARRRRLSSSRARLLVKEIARSSASVRRTASEGTRRRRRNSSPG